MTMSARSKRMIFKHMRDSLSKDKSHIALMCLMSGGLVSPLLGQECSPFEEAKLLATDGNIHTADNFGASIAVGLETVLVGAWGSHEAGGAYVFALIDGEWIEQAAFIPEDGDGLDYFGWSVSISKDGDTALIGSIWNDEIAQDAGSAYVFVRENDVWTFQTKFLASDGQAFDDFGISVALSDDGNTAFVGAREHDTSEFDAGAVYVFVRDEVDVWSLHSKLISSDAGRADWFGTSVAIDGTTALIGAFKNDEVDLNTGAAYIFELIDDQWVEQQKLIDPDGNRFDNFGHAVSLDGDVALIGAYRSNAAGTNSGAAYIFERSDGVWSEQALLVASDGAEEDWFGFSVSVSGGTAVVGAVSADPLGTGSGAAYVFTRSDGAWTEQEKILAGDGSSRDLFGYSVSVYEDTAGFGADGDDVFGDFTGSAYIFDLGCAGLPCLADLDGNGLLNFLDISAFLDAFGNQEPAVDFVSDGSFNFLDVSAFLLIFGQGCP